MLKKENGLQNQKTESDRIRRWRWILDQNVPVIGGWMHRRITSSLIESAVSGNWLAAQSLALVFAMHEDEDVRQMAGQTLRKINFATGIDAVWGIWAETRHPELQDIVLEYNRPASHPSTVRLLSLLKLNMITGITNGSADLVPPLVQALSDHDPQVRERAGSAVTSLHNPTSIDMLCQMWRNSRDAQLEKIVQQSGYVAQKPAAARVLSALTNNRIDVIMQSHAEMVPALIDACDDTDPLIAARARESLPHLQNQAAVDEFCRLWSETRSPLLENALLQARYKARGAQEVRLLVALKTGNIETAKKSTPQGLPYLFKSLADQDAAIRENAHAALMNLRLEETRDALCAHVITGDIAQARDFALTAGYAPRQPEDRALFYFFTEQWQAYDELDFDQSMMRAIYEASPDHTRRRIADLVQAAGRTRYLTIMAGVDLRSRADRVTASEASLMVRILAQNREFSRLWALIPELSLPFSLEIIKILSQSSWHPEGEADIMVYDELERLSRLPILLSDPELSRQLPPAIQRATLKIKGRVNEVAFSPNLPQLAIATSQRKVVLWNFQIASIERVIDSFKHSVGKVNYTPNGRLICAERTSTNAMCNVTVIEESDSFSLCAHNGTVTVVAPLSEERLLTAGRDQKVFLWDLKQQRKLAEKEFPFWARSAAISPDQQTAGLLHDRLFLVRLPSLIPVPGYPFLSPRSGGFKQGVAQNAAFAPDGKFILAGQHNGQVGLHYHTSMTQRPRQALVSTHSMPVRGIHFLPDHPIVVTAGGEGLVRFTTWPEIKPFGAVATPDGHLTSLRVSQNGNFMATGSNDASLVLWDLRVLDIPNLFAQPLATASHDQIATVMALSEYGSLPEEVRNGLRFLRTILQYRFRYDIQLDEAPTIQFGEFDIILDEIK